MFKNGDYIKRLNMKVAGTLPGFSLTPKPKQEHKPSEPNPMYEGLTAKQKKNLKKKL